MARRRSNKTGSIRRRGNSHQVRMKVNGVEHSFTIKGYTDKEAEKWSRNKYTELEQAEPIRGLPDKRMRCSALFKRFEEVRLTASNLSPSTKKTYGNSLKAFRSYFVDQGDDPRVSDVKAGHIEDFLFWRRRHRPDGTLAPKPLSPRALAKDRTTLFQVFGFADTLEVIDSNPVAKTKAPDGDAREPLILDADQYEDLLKACKDRPMLQTYVLVLGETGLRCDSEALWLRWQDLDFRSGFLTVEGQRKGRRTKSGKSRKVPMTRRIREALQEHAAAYQLKMYKGNRSEWVFHHTVDRRRAKAGQRIGCLRNGFMAAVDRAGLPEDLHQHDLRHRRVTTWLQEGHPIHLVRDAMGHSTVKVTEGYLHLVPNDLLSLVEEPTQKEFREMVR